MIKFTLRETISSIKSNDNLEERSWIISDLIESQFYKYDNSVCLFVLRFNVPVNNFSVITGRGHKTAEVGFEPPTSRSGVRRSTTEPPRSPTILHEFLLDVRYKSKCGPKYIQTREPMVR